MTDNSFYPEMQSSYRKGHIVVPKQRVVNNILIKMNSQEVTLLVVLDLGADTVNHDMLIKRLHEELGIADLALRWVESYLHNRVQKVHIDGLISNPFDLCSRVLMGCVFV